MTANVNEIFLSEIAIRRMKKIILESRAVPPVSQNFAFSRQTFGFLFFTGEMYIFYYILPSKALSNGYMHNN